MRRSGRSGLLALGFWLAMSLGLVGQAIPPAFFGTHINRRGAVFGAGNPFPTIPFAGYRTIDSFGTLWNGIETSSGVYDFTRLDLRLSDAQTLGVDVLYTVYSTPSFHSSSPSDATCGTGLGACDPPSDVNADGSGTDASLKNFLTALLNHVGAKIAYYEMWNEANITTEWTGTNAQLVRMAKDMRTIVLAKNPAAKLLSPSFADLTFASAATKEAAYLATSVGGSTGSQAADIINFHGYVVTASHPIPLAENEVLNLTNLRADLTGTDLAKPLWDTEWGYSQGLGDPDMDASFVARHLLIQAGQGVTRTYYYDWDSNDERALWSASLTNCLGSGTASAGGYLCETGTAYQQAESWLSGATMTSSCSGPMPPSTGIWSCALTTAAGVSAMAVWDTSKSCSGGICTTSPYTTAVQFAQYQTLAGGSPLSISAHSLALGIKPLLLLAPPGGGGGGGGGLSLPTFLLGEHAIAAAGSCAFTLRIISTGSAFSSQSVVNWNGSPRVTAVLFPRVALVTIPAADLAAGGSFAITVTTPLVGTIAAGTFTVIAAAPTISSSYSLGGTLIVNGANFVPRNTVVALNGTVLATAWISATQVQAWLPPGNINPAGAVTVSNTGCEAD